jgi:hypothetical protein
MALWGKSELIYKDGRVNVHFTEKEIRRHSGSINFTTAGIQTGDIITVGTAVTVGAGSTVGFAIVSGIVGVHTLTIYSTEHLVGSGTILNQDYYINEKPKYLLDDSTYDAPEVQSNRTVSVVGVDVAEAGIAKTTSYAVEHAGWVGIQTYTDMHGRLRVKSETLVAFSGITSDRVTKFVPGFEQ